MFGLRTRLDGEISGVREVAQAAQLLATTAATKVAEHVEYCTQREKVNDRRHEENKAEIAKVVTSVNDMRTVLGRIAWKFFWGMIVMVVTMIGFIIEHAFSIHLTVN